MSLVQRIIRDVPQHWVGDGFPVRTMFSYRDGAEFDPFLLLDYAGPLKFDPADNLRGVGEHPHRGFETVTIVYSGELQHRDSSGGSGTIGAGDVQWMTAASGVVHEELHSADFSKSGGILEMVQLWVNLPKSVKMSKPRYQELRSDAIPVVPLMNDSGTIRVIAGSYEATVGPAKTFTEINLWDGSVTRASDLVLTVPMEHHSLLLVRRGRMNVGDESIEAGELAVVANEQGKIAMSPQSGCEFLFLSGIPIQEPIVGQGPFVMNTPDEIRQAIEDYRLGRMGHLPS